MTGSPQILYSVIIPAFNEENYLRPTVEAVKKAMAAINEPGELIVVDNNSTDRTAKIADELGCQVVFEKINQISRSRNAGGRKAVGRFLVFIDADTIIRPELLEATIANLDKGGCCGGGAMVEMDIELNGFWRGFVKFWNWLSAYRKIAAGSYVYCLKEGFEAVNGFSEKVFASEEIWFSRDLKKWGRKRQLKFMIIRNYPVITSGRKLEWISPWRMFWQFMLIIVVFPFGITSKRLCRHLWYYRPEEQKTNKKNALR